RDAALFIARAAAAHRDGPGSGFLVADDEHVARLALLCLFHPVAQVTRLRVEMDAEVFRAQLRRDGARVVERRLANRDARDLLPVEPSRKVSGVVLDQTADETLQAAEEHAVDHDGALALALLIHERDVEALG